MWTHKFKDRYGFDSVVVENTHKRLTAIVGPVGHASMDRGSLFLIDPQAGFAVIIYTHTYEPP